jgi:ribonuclease P protein component
MKKQYSLKESRDFNTIINKGVKQRSKFLFIASVDAKDFKLGISIPKKLGNAVFRNKNKRRIKNIIQELKPYDLKKHIVIVVKKEFTELTFEKMKQILERDLSKIK